MLQSQSRAVEPHEERGLRLDGSDARDVFTTVVHHRIDITLDILQALTQPLATMAVGGPRGGHRQKVGGTLLVGFQVMEEGLTQVRILDDAPRTHNAGDVERLAGSTHYHTHGSRIVAHGKERCVSVPTQHQVAMNLVAEDHHIILPCQRCHLALHIGRPCDTDGVVRVAQHHHAGMLGLENALQVLQVHFVEARRGAAQGVIDHHAVIARDEHSEGVVYRFLYHHLVTGAGEMVQCQPKAVHDATDKASLLLGKFQAVALTLPVDD